MTSFLAEVKLESISDFVIMIAIAIIPNLLTPGVIFAGDRMVKSFISRGTTGALRFWLFAKPAVLALSILVPGWWALTGVDPWQTRMIFMTVFSSLFSLWVLWRPMLDFANCGIAGVDPQLKNGIDYQKSLKLCHNELCFLGVGSSKLTQHQPEFEAAIRRSSGGSHTVRFLLCDPKSPQLIAFAKRRGVAHDSFQKSVKESIDKLKKLRDDAKLNIEINIYTARNESEMPLFRLMFINGDTCLASHTVFGEGIEGDLPQFLIRKIKGLKHKHSLYYAMDMYFEQMWRASQPA